MGGSWPTSGSVARAGRRAIAATGGPSRVEAATGELVVVDRHTGLAISGFDPVAYFIDTPSPGRGEFEATFAGAVWRFRNAGNRAAFVADPEVYMPRFGGYDPVAVAVASRCRETRCCG